jgi:hypothetical protein
MALSFSVEVYAASQKDLAENKISRVSSRDHSVNDTLKPFRASVTDVAVAMFRRKGFAAKLAWPEFALARPPRRVDEFRELAVLKFRPRQALPKATGFDRVICSARPLDGGQPKFHRFSGDEDYDTSIAAHAELKGVPRSLDGCVGQKRVHDQRVPLSRREWT